MSASHWIRAGAVGLAAVSYGFKVAIWYWPWNREALLNETVMLAAAFAVSLAIVIVIQMRSKRRLPIAVAAVLGGTLYLAGSFAGLALVGAEAPGFGRYRFYVFSGPGCEFRARFPRPPDAFKHSDTIDRTGGLDVAMLVDVGQVMTMTAECVDGGPTPDAKMALQAWASSAGVIVTEIVEMGGAVAPVIRLRGFLEGSILGPGHGGRAGRTAVESRVYSGERSTLRLTVTRADGEPPGSEAESFLASGRRR